MNNYILRAHITTNDTTKKVAVRDLLLSDDNSGVRSLFDFGFPWCYPAGNLPRPPAGDPLDGALVRDISKSQNDASVLKPSGVVMTYDGGGITKSAGAQAVAPTYATVNTSNSLSGFTQSTKYLIVTYLKIANLANWPANGSATSSFISACDEWSNNYTNSKELVWIASTPVSLGGLGSITARFQSAIGSVTRLDIELPTGLNLYDTDIVQVAVWFDGTSANLRIKSNLFEQTESLPFTGNTEDISSNNVKFDTSAGQFGGVSVPHKLYRGFIENLTESGRVATDVIDEDFARVVERTEFS